MAKRKMAPRAGDPDELPDNPPPEDPKDDELRPLNHKQIKFCQFYVDNGGNATQAYLRAYACGYQTANSNGPDLLVDTRISERIEFERDRISKMLAFNREQYMRILMGMAMYKPSDYHDMDLGAPMSELGDLEYGMNCKGSDRKAALDELKVMLGFGPGTNQGPGGVVDPGVRDAARRVRKQRSG